MQFKADPMARRHAVSPPRRNTDANGVVAVTRGRAEDWDCGVGVVAPLDVESCLARPSMDLGAWALYATISAYWSAGHTEIRLSALARSAGLPKKAVEGALRRAGGKPWADGGESSAKRLPKGVTFIYEVTNDRIVRLHRALEAWRNQGVYVLMPVDVLRAAPSAPAFRLLIAMKGVAVRRDGNALRSWPREKLRIILGLPPAADVDAVVANALPWVRDHLGTDHHVAVDFDDGRLTVAAGPAERAVANLLADGFDPLTNQARYAAKDVLRRLTVFDGPADGKRMVLPGLWLHRAADYLAKVGAPITAEQLRGQWLVHTHAARQRVSTPLAIEADLGAGVRAAFPAFVDAVARLAADGKAWSLSKADLEFAEAARLRRWLLRDGSIDRVHAWTADGRVMTAAMWRDHARQLGGAVRAEEAVQWHVGQLLPAGLPMPSVSAGVLVEADVVAPAVPAPQPPRFVRVDAADIQRALTCLANEDSGETDRALVRLAAAHARDLADAPSRLLKLALRDGDQPHRGLAQLVLRGGSRYAGDVSVLWRDAADAMACEGHGDDREDVLRRASDLLGKALRQAQEAVLEENAERAAVREEMLSRASDQRLHGPAAPAVIEPLAEQPTPTTAAPSPRPPIRRPFAVPTAGRATAPIPAAEAFTAASAAEIRVGATVLPIVPGETLERLRKALASLPRGRVDEDPDRGLANCYLPTLAAELEADGRTAENLRFRMLLGVDDLVDGLRRPDGVERVDFEGAVTAAAEVMRDVGLGSDSTTGLRVTLAFIVARQLTRTLEAFGRHLGLGQADATHEAA